MVRRRDKLQDPSGISGGMDSRSVGTFPGSSCEAFRCNGCLIKQGKES